MHWCSCTGRETLRLNCSKKLSIWFSMLVGELACIFDAGFCRYLTLLTFAVDHCAFLHDLWRVRVRSVAARTDNVPLRSFVQPAKLALSLPPSGAIWSPLMLELSRSSLVYCCTAAVAAFPIANTINFKLRRCLLHFSRRIVP